MLDFVSHADVLNILNRRWSQWKLAKSLLNLPRLGKYEQYAVQSWEDEAALTSEISVNDHQKNLVVGLIRHLLGCGPHQYHQLQKSHGSKCNLTQLQPSPKHGCSPATGLKPAEFHVCQATALWL